MSTVFSANQPLALEASRVRALATPISEFDRGSRLGVRSVTKASLFRRVGKEEQESDLFLDPRISVISSGFRSPFDVNPITRVISSGHGSDHFRNLFHRFLTLTWGNLK